MPPLSHIRWLSTHCGACCPSCACEYHLDEPTDILARRPVRISVHCPECGAQSNVLLTNRQLLGGISLNAPARNSLPASGEVLVSSAAALRPSKLPTMNSGEHQAMPANDSTHPPESCLEQARTERKITIKPLPLDPVLMGSGGSSDRK